MRACACDTTERVRKEEVCIMHLKSRHFIAVQSHVKLDDSVAVSNSVLLAHTL